MKLTANQAMAARMVGNYINPGQNIFGAMPNSNPKHNLAYDFGYPTETEIDFNSAYRMYRRHGIAKALVTRTAGKTWQDQPALRESEDDHEETGLELTIRQKFSSIRLWQSLAETDTRSMVGKYAGVLLRLADGNRWDQPVGAVSGGINGLVGVIPAWEEQLEVSEWHTDPTSESYGQPKMFMFNENAVDNETGKMRQFTVHPDRVYVWSKDRTTWGESKLESCYNALMDVEKIRGAGGEGFWKNAKAQPVLQASPDVDFNQLAAMLGTDTAGLPDALDDVVAKWSKGFDVSLILQGMEAKTLSVTLPSPEHFYNIALQEIAASWPIPQKVLVGMQTGERASTEDAREWAQINMSRRSMMVVPNIMDIIEKLERVGVLPERDWYIDWSDLTAPTLGEKVEILKGLSDVNQKNMGSGGMIFTADELRAMIDYEPLVGDEGFSEIVEEEGEEDGDEEQGGDE